MTTTIFRRAWSRIRLELSRNAGLYILITDRRKTISGGMIPRADKKNKREQRGPKAGKHEADRERYYIVRGRGGGSGLGVVVLYSSAVVR